MKNWQDRVSKEVKQLFDINTAKRAFEIKISNKIKKGYPKNKAEILAKNEMSIILKEKGLHVADIVHFLHVCEVLDYSGCGCCEHRK